MQPSSEKLQKVSKKIRRCILLDILFLETFSYSWRRCFGAGHVVTARPFQIPPQRLCIATSPRGHIAWGRVRATSSGKTTAWGSSFIMIYREGEAVLQSALRNVISQGSQDG